MNAASAELERIFQDPMAVTNAFEGAGFDAIADKLDGAAETIHDVLEQFEELGEFKRRGTRRHA